MSTFRRASWRLAGFMNVMRAIEEGIDWRKGSDPDTPITVSISASPAVLTEILEMISAGLGAKPSPETHIHITKKGFFG